LQFADESNVEDKSARKSRKGDKSQLSDSFDPATRFNALRFLAMSLKSQNDTMIPDKLRI